MRINYGEKFLIICLLSIELENWFCGKINLFKHTYLFEFVGFNLEERVENKIKNMIKINEINIIGGVGILCRKSLESLTPTPLSLSSNRLCFLIGSLMASSTELNVLNRKRSNIYLVLYSNTMKLNSVQDQDETSFSFFFTFTFC